MSNSVEVPTASVVISFDYSLMARFALHGSLVQLKKEALESGTADTGIFDNSINSTLISLEHKYNKENDGAFIEVEFVDPNHSFEKTTLATPFNYSALLNINSPLDDYIKYIQKELAELYPWPTKPKSKGGTKLPPNIYRRVAQSVTDAYRQMWDPGEGGVFGHRKPTADQVYGEKYKHLIDVVDPSDPLAPGPVYGVGGSNALVGSNVDYRIKGLLKASLIDRRNYLTNMLHTLRKKKAKEDREHEYELSPGKISAANKKLLYLLAEEHLSKNISRRPVYIAYGLGNNIKRDWCSPQCFGRVVKAEYSFNGTGARTLKLIFAGDATIGGVLTKLGTTALGDAGAKVVTMGKSYRLFNPESDNKLLELLEELQTEADNRGDVAADSSMVPGHEEHRHGGPRPPLEKVVYPPIASPENSFWTPSFHMAFVMCMHSYIRAAVPKTFKDNVLVLLPNLDKYLSGEWTALFNGTPSHDKYTPGKDWHSGGIWPKRGTLMSQKGRQPDLTIGDPDKSIRATPPIHLGGDENAMRWYNAFGLLAEKLGLTLTAGSHGYDITVPGGVLDNSQPVVGGGGIPGGTNQEPGLSSQTGAGAVRASDPNVLPPMAFPARVWDVHGRAERERLSYLQNKQSLAAFWNDRYIYLMCDNNYFTPFAEKLKKVGSSLVSAFASNPESDTPPINPKLYIETDLVVLQALKDANLISDATIPAVIWADAYMKIEFLDARIMERNNEYALTSRQKYMHYSDVLRLPNTYYKEVFEHFNPPPDPGLFGGTSKSEEDLNSLLAGDPNVKESFDAFAKRAPNLGDRIPIFTLGVKSPNVLKIDLDLNNVFTNFIQTTQGVNRVNSILNSQYILGGVNRNVNYLGGTHSLIDFFSDFSEWKAEKKRREEAFKAVGNDEVWIPQKFKDIMKPFYENMMGAMLDAHGQWGAFDQDKYDRSVGNILAPEKLPVGGAINKVSRYDNYIEEIRSKAGSLVQDSSQGRGMAPTQGENEFYELMWGVYSDLYSQAGEEHLSMSYIQQTGKDSIHQSIRQNANIIERMMQMQLVGKIDTLPMFSLSNTRLALNRSCLLYSREPRFSNVGIQASQSSIDNTTWFSGMYTLYGWHHKIASNEVTSSFNLSRDLRYTKD